MLPFTLFQDAAASALTIVSVWPELFWLKVMFGAALLLFLDRLLTKTNTTAARTTVMATIRMTPMTGLTASSLALKAWLALLMVCTLEGERPGAQQLVDRRVGQAEGAGTRGAVADG